MTQNKTPKIWQKASAKNTPNKVLAKIDMSEKTLDSGLCPDCKKKMMDAYIGDEKVLACVTCRICLPMKNRTVDKNGL